MSGRRYLTEYGMVEVLRAACAEAGGQKIWAYRAKIGPKYVNNILAGRAPPGGSVIAALGYRRRVIFEKIEKPGSAAHVDIFEIKETQT